MIDFSLSPADEAQIRDILLGWRAEGVAAPLLPMEVDVDGDGLVDSWGLGPGNSVIIVPSAPLSLTVFRSDGDGLIEGS